MKKSFQFFLGVCFLLPASGCQQEKPVSRLPNIVFLYADDLGWTDLGIQGSDFYETPNLDRLAQEGMRFTQAYANAANCAPSRACLMTGSLSSPSRNLYRQQFRSREVRKSADHSHAKYQDLRPQISHPPPGPSTSRLCNLCGREVAPFR